MVQSFGIFLFDENSQHKQIPTQMYIFKDDIS